MTSENSPQQQQMISNKIREISPEQGKRFSRLDNSAAEIAVRGIERHFKACAKQGVKPDAAALREIIDDAIRGIAVYETVNTDQLSA